MPEIARRCLQCGATVRARAQFCSQCGRPMVRRAASGGESNGGVGVAAQKETTRVEDTEEKRAAPSSRAKVIVRADDEGRRRGGERIARVREHSRVVLDEAADDPGLRFVLVALLVFAIFVVVLVLSLIFR